MKVKKVKVKEKKLTEGATELMGDIMNLLTNDPASNLDVDYLIERSDAFNTVLKKEYLTSRIRLASVLCKLYESKLGQDALDDNNESLRLSKEYLDVSNAYRKFVVNPMITKPEHIYTFKKNYFDFKESTVMQDAIIIYSNLKTPEEDVYPFKDLTDYKLKDLNMKLIYTDSLLDEDIVTKIKEIVENIKEACKKICDFYMTPDFNPETITPLFEEMFNQLVNSIPGCHKAKKIIKNSSKLFANNFHKYFISFKKSSSVFAIFEDYIQDVSQEVKGDNGVLLEISCLMSSIKKKIESQKSKFGENAKVNKFMDLITNVMDKLGKEDEINTTELMNEAKEMMCQFVVKEDE